MIMAIPDELQDTYPVVVPKHNFARFSRNQLAYWHDKGKIKTCHAKLKLIVFFNFGTSLFNPDD